MDFSSEARTRGMAFGVEVLILHRRRRGGWLPRRRPRSMPLGHGHVSEHGDLVTGDFNEALTHGQAGFHGRLW